ncbi:target of EGR1 protein 1-like [Anneissia japonica]|uniref:target of EGR1 protein 1-like n=1 Tax=Anneissia japonica TaxID=1529436 RepID=UPI0014254CF5|nr:target of EGR1 protein 1-like [Anneissia japonica]
MATFENVPVVDVHSDNISIIWPSLLLAVRSANFLAIDFELSGLGNRRNLVTRSMDDRYKFISDVAKTRSILAIGLACFKANGTSSDTLGLQFQVQTFNITTLCNEEYVVEPDALQFLVNHGFDFNKQYSKGMNYSRGADTIKERSLDKSNSNRHMAEGKHRAGFDAFMTGFSFATFIGKYGVWKETEVMNNQMSLGSRFQVEDLTNRLYLSGKSVPLLVEKSHFSKTSSHHREKFQKICPPTFKHVTQVVLESVGLS